MTFVTTMAQDNTAPASPPTSAGTTFRGLTWDHPRGYNALAQASAQSVTNSFPDNLIAWEKQPLSGFEEHPIADLAARFDLIVLDHPHIGEAVAYNCLQPLEAYFSDTEIAHWKQSSVGQALASYYWDGKHWALPIDVASQVTAYNPALVKTLPATWDDVIHLSERVPVALSVAGPHAFLTLMSICASLGAEPTNDDNLLDDDVVTQALSIMTRLHARAPTRAWDLNPISLLETMASSDDIALIPLVFGYVNYSAAQLATGRVAFGDAPRSHNGTQYGSVLGGTGIAITANTTVTPELTNHLRWLMNDMTQTEFFPAHEGQPSARVAWNNAAINHAWGNFYRDTLATIDDAIVRPRFDGYIAFQKQASQCVRDHLENGNQAEETLTQLRLIWQSSRAQARGLLHSNPKESQ